MSSEKKVSKKQESKFLVDVNEKKAVSKVITEESSDKPLSVLPKELNGPKGLEPTRYGDWESKGRCYDF